MVRQAPLLTVFLCQAPPSVLGAWSMALVLWLLYELFILLELPTMFLQLVVIVPNRTIGDYSENHNFW